MQRYDPDPAAKAAAATVLASKLGADSGLKVYLGDESQFNAPTGKSNDVEAAQSSGLRNRKQVHTKSSSAGSTPVHDSNEGSPRSEGTQGPQSSEHNQLVVSHHYPQGPATIDGGWIARIAALLVGEDPTQSYALICGNCHMHNGESHLYFFLLYRCTPAFIVEPNQELFCNSAHKMEKENLCFCLLCTGLARKEEFPYITYYCPHCHALNKPKQSEEERVSGSSTPNLGSLRTQNASASASDSGVTNNSPVRAGLEEIEEVTEKVTSEDVASSKADLSGTT